MLLVNLSQDYSSLNSYISNTLLKEIELKNKEQKKVILYLNKRWEYSSLICSECSHLHKCSQCDISMSVHKYPEKLICHICHLSIDIPKSCEKCNQNTLKKVWIWTQQIEDSLKKYFPNTNIFRFDTDTTKNKTQKNEALQKLKEAKIIIGTKMITTGFDFEQVGLIWVILLEQELLIPKYNTEEKVYSNIKQLLWRWNRKWEHSEIVIQTFIPENQIVQSITNANYKDFFTQTLQERKAFGYPPFHEMLTLEYRNKNKQKAYDFICQLKNKLDIENKSWLDIRLIPHPEKRYNQFYYKIIIKWNKLRDFIQCIKAEIFKNSWLIVIFE